MFVWHENILCILEKDIFSSLNLKSCLASVKKILLICVKNKYAFKDFLVGNCRVLHGL